MHIDKIDKFAFYRTAGIIAATAFILWGCLVVLWPFLPAVLLAVILSLSTWPAFVWLKARLHNRVGLASLLMTFFLAICFLVPLAFLGTSLVENYDSISKLFMTALQQDMSVPPPWVSDFPLLGSYFASLWTEYGADTDKLAATLGTYAGPASQLLISVGKALGRGLLDLSLGVVIAYFFFRHGTQVAHSVSRLIERFAGPRGERLLLVSKQTMIGVVYGILGTALAQGALAGIGFALAGVPGAPFLGLVTFVLSFIPMGPPLIWLPISIWFFTEDMMGHAIFMAVWGLLVISAIDNIVRPYFISLGSSLPLLLVLLGVFGGMIGFGFIGIFIGPTLLALAYTIIVELSHGEATHLPGPRTTDGI